MLKEVRAEVGDLLTAAGLEAHHFEPERLAPPLVVVTAGSPYVETGETFTDNTMRLDLILIPQKGSNEKEQDDVDDMIEQTLAALPDWHLESVSEPYVPQAGTAEYLAVKVTVTASVTL